jgi:hypothetical protein
VQRRLKAERQARALRTQVINVIDGHVSGDIPTPYIACARLGGSRYANSGNEELLGPRV